MFTLCCSAGYLGLECVGVKHVCCNTPCPPRPHCSYICFRKSPCQRASGWQWDPSALIFGDCHLFFCIKYLQRAKEGKTGKAKKWRKIKMGKTVTNVERWDREEWDKDAGRVCSWIKEVWSRFKNTQPWNGVHWHYSASRGLLSRASGTSTHFFAN